jgi:hypothetical protein
VPADDVLDVMKLINKGWLQVQIIDYRYMLAHQKWQSWYIHEM